MLKINMVAFTLHLLLLCVSKDRKGYVRFFRLLLFVQLRNGKEKRKSVTLVRMENIRLKMWKYLCDRSKTSTSAETVLRNSDSVEHLLEVLTIKNTDSVESKHSGEP